MILNSHSYFSFKYGTLSTNALLNELKKSGHQTAALTDINNTSGILNFFREAGNYNIHPVAGIDFRNGIQQQYVGIAKNAEGFKELNDHLSFHLYNKIPFEETAPSFQHCYIIYPFSQKIKKLKEHEFIGIKPDDLNRLTFSGYIKDKKLFAKLVAFPTFTFTGKASFNSHRLLRAMDLNTILSKLTVEEQGNAADCFLSVEDLISIYKDYPELLLQSQSLLRNCFIDFEFHINKNKKTFTGNAADDYKLLIQKCDEGMLYRYPQQNDEIRDRYKKEIDLISNLNFASYFLINCDIINYARRQGFFYVGRGSGANSMVAYLLNITDVDPIDLDLYFERFINPYRTSPPDFDIDFSWKDRDQVINYIFNESPFSKHNNVALLATYSTLQSNAVTRELGKVFGLPKEEIDALGDEDFIGKGKQDHIYKLIYRYAQLLHDTPTHLSIHAGGILISEKSMHYYTATVMPPKGFPLTQFSMLEAEDVGLYKFDILSQRGLGKIKDSVEIIKYNRGEEVDVHNIRAFKEDEKVRKNLKAAKLMGCFYVESPAMRMLLTKLKAEAYLALVAASSIIRPGVAQSGMMNEYIKRFHNQDNITYIHPKMKELMEDTFGVMVYQEDVIKVAHHFAGLTLAEADMLRRGMSGKYRAREEFQKVKDQFFINCKNFGYSDFITNEVWRQIESFAGYAFSKGHSASYAVESYQCMYLKTYYPLEFMVSVINNEGGFYSKEFYVHEARMCGAGIHAPDINTSEYLTIIRGTDIYLGWHMVAELESGAAEIFLNERTQNGIYTSLENFMMRVEIAVEQLRLLIRAGAFRFTGRTKKQLLWDIHMVVGSEKKTEVHNDLFAVERKSYAMPELFYDKYDDAFDEIELFGFPLCSPFELLKIPSPSELNAQDLIKHLGKIISITGYLVTRKHTSTKKGLSMAFGTFLDSKGIFFDTTHFPEVFKNYPFRGRSCCYLVTGKVVEEFGFYSMEVTKMEMLEMKQKI
ncbi:MAG: DNA polymerase III subunit alpha [Bacteroidota bacterium]